MRRETLAVAAESANAETMIAAGRTARSIEPSIISCPRNAKPANIRAPASQFPFAAVIERSRTLIPMRRIACKPKASSSLRAPYLFGDRGACGPRVSE